MPAKPTSLSGPVHPDRFFPKPFDIIELLDWVKH